MIYKAMPCGKGNLFSELNNRLYGYINFILSL